MFIKFIVPSRVFFLKIRNLTAYIPLFVVKFAITKIPINFVMANFTVEYKQLGLIFF